MQKLHGRDWLYVKLWYTEHFWGWSSDDVGTWVVLIITGKQGTATGGTGTTVPCC